MESRKLKSKAQKMESKPAVVSDGSSFDKDDNIEATYDDSSSDASNL